MKLLSGSILLLAAEQAFAHAKMVPFPNDREAAVILLPACVVFLALGSLLLAWGLLTERRSVKTSDQPASRP